MTCAAYLLADRQIAVHIRDTRDLEEIGVPLGNDTLGRPVARALAAAKLAEIDTQMFLLERAKEIIRWGMSCQCPSIDACTCGIHRELPV